MKYLVLMPIVFLARGVRWLRNPNPFVLSCEGKKYVIPHHGRSLSEVKAWFENYYKHALICPLCNCILLPGEKVSRCGKNSIAHYDTHCVEKPDYLGVIGKDGHIIYAYPGGRSMEEMARNARAAKARD